MAERIEGPYDFGRYGFAEYADGATWILTHDEDYYVNGTTIVTNARKWAKQVGFDVEARVIEPPSGPQQVALRFTPDPRS